LHPLLADLLSGFSPAGRLPQDAFNFLKFHECPNTADHSRSVALTALNLAERFKIDRQQAEGAAWLHDISAVFPNARRVSVSNQLGIEILTEEAQIPLLLHQKISAVMASDIFGISDQAVLDAIGCHTTLRGNPTDLDMLLFAADKLSWDQRGVPPFKAEMLSALDQSLEAAVWVYLDFMWYSGKMTVVHPWMRDAHEELKPRYKML
jgi:predicted HD superfamily hydrolase involved in NAD metabolism